MSKEQSNFKIVHQIIFLYLFLKLEFYIARNLVNFHLF